MNQPPDDAALVARLRAYRPTDEWGEGVHHVICTEAATALEAKDRRIAELEAGRQQDDEQLFRTAAAWAVIFQAAHGREPNVHEATAAAKATLSRAALEPSDKGVGR